MKTTCSAFIFVLFGVLAFQPQVAAETIYKCRSLGGGSFWSQSRCDDRNALNESSHTVPDDMSFKDQVGLVESHQKEQARRKRADEDERRQRERCHRINEELARIEQPYQRGEYVPVEQVNKDQRRSRELKSQRSKLNCLQD